MNDAMNPAFFKSADEFRAWLEANHDTAKELWVGYHKKGTGKPSMTWPESVDQALCFGWIDGIRKSVNENSYTNRFTPRKRTSNWSTVNINRVQELIRLGLMQPAGLKAFEERDQKKDQSYSYEARERGLSEAYQEQFKTNAKAWDFFESQPASYKKGASWWVMSAKQEVTQKKRLAQLIEDSAHERRIALFSRGK
jgi:uncharacterized protein YdeI (YjbR/CyaY-like superfamily)